MKKRKLLTLLTIFLPMAAALLSAMPNAVKLNFATPDETIVEYFSGYSMMPVGYAVWGAFGGAVGAVVITLLGAVTAIRKGKGIINAMFIIALIASALSLSTALFGCMTAVGGIITALLIAEAGLVYYIRESERKNGS